MERQRRESVTRSRRSWNEIQAHGLRLLHPRDDLLISSPSRDTLSVIQFSA